MVKIHTRIDAIELSTAKYVSEWKYSCLVILPARHFLSTRTDVDHSLGIHLLINVLHGFQA